MKLQRFLPVSLFVLLISASLFAGSGTAFAQTSSVSNMPICFAISNNVRYGMFDYSTNGDLSILQHFLANHGYLSSSALGTGHFGPLTLAAVLRFQSAEGLPATGFVGPLTRALINKLGCQPLPTPTSGVTLNSELPTSGAIGTNVSITGYGFTSDNTVLFNGLIVARDVPISSSIGITGIYNGPINGIQQTLNFTVPSSLSPNCPTGSMCPMFVELLQPGQYTLTVQNSNGTSNSLTFTVTSGNSSSSSLNVTGLNAPSTLVVGQIGTWTVQVSGTNVGQLNYSVNWGDNTTLAPAMAASAIQTQTSATFTHVYQQAGTYSPVFTVTDNNGDTITTSNTITVTPLY